MIDCEACAPELPPARAVVCYCTEDCGAISCRGRMVAAVAAIGDGLCPVVNHGPLGTGWAAGWCGRCGGMWQIVQATRQTGVSFTEGWAVAVGAPPPEVPG